MDSPSSPKISKKSAHAQICLNEGREQVEETEVMFWGLKLEKGKNYTQVVENSFHISQATLVPGDENGVCRFTTGLVAVHAIMDETDYTLCYLGRVNEEEPPNVQQALNLEFVEGETITLYMDIRGVFSKEKSNTVHLTGYFSQLLPNCLFGSDESVLGDGEDLYNFESGDESAEEAEGDIKTLLPTIEELSDESETADDHATKKRKRDKENNDDITLRPSAPKKKKKKKKEVSSDGEKKRSGTDSEKEKGKAASEIKKVSSFKTDGGTEVQEIEIGSGRLAKPGKKVFVKYTGRLAHNNRIFDSNIDGKRDFMFRLGQGEVVKGWDHGIKGMRVGGKRKLVIPPSQGYGTKGAPPKIPPNSKLIFDVELTNVK